MGKKNKKRGRQHDGGHRPNKKHHKKGGYWINTCRESKPKEGKPDALMTVVISQANLTDDHTHVAREKGQESVIDASKEPKSVGKVSTTESKTLEVSKDTAKETAAEAECSSPMKDSHAAKSQEENSKQGVDYSHAFISVQRLSSASGPQKVYEDKNFRPLPNGDCGDGIVSPYLKGEVADKYWAQRKRLFSRYDDGIELDKEGWYSVTPEAIANHIAKRIVEASSTSGLIILDTFCGCGGNAIAFARRPEVSLVVCVDTDLSRLEMAAKNAAIYDIESKKLLFIHDNAIRVLSIYSNGKLMELPTTNDEKEPTNLCGYACNGQLPERLDCIFLSPPWGGTEYEQLGRGHFSVKTHVNLNDANNNSVNGEELLSMSQKAVGPCVYFLPRNLNGIAMGRSALQAGYTGSIELEKNVLNDKFKTISVYLGFVEEAERPSSGDTKTAAVESTETTTESVEQTKQNS